MIKTTVIGNLGSDATVSEFNSRKVINFSIANTEKYKDAQGVQHEKVLWIKASYWPTSIAIAPYLRKGGLIFCEGIPEVSVYQDKTGKWQADFKLRVQSIQLLGGNQNNQQGSQGNYAQRVGQGQQAATGQIENNQGSSSTDLIEDLPF